MSDDLVWVEYNPATGKQVVWEQRSLRRCDGLHHPEWYGNPPDVRPERPLRTPDQRADRLAAMPLRPGETQWQRDEAVQRIRKGK